MVGQSRLVFDWTIAPSSDIIPRLAALHIKLIAALRALFDVFAAKIQAYAQRAAPWKDVTGIARKGLRAFATGDGLQLTLYLVTSAFYGVFLELGTRYMAPRPIVMPALQAHYAELVAAIGALMRSL